VLLLATDKQIHANQASAKLSSRPVTDQSKASRMQVSTTARKLRLCPSKNKKPAEALLLGGLSLQFRRLD
jgi:hypothetical protein